MKSSIVFLDSLENSKRGTLRGLVIFPLFILMTLAWFAVTKKKLYRRHIDEVGKLRVSIALGVSALLVVSALGVHTPDTAKKAASYAGLVGLVVYGITNASMLAAVQKWGFKIAIIDTVWGVLSTALLGYLLFEVVQKWPNTFAAV